MAASARSTKRTNEVGGSYIVVETGPWIFAEGAASGGRHRDGRPGRAERSTSNRTKDEIKNSPEFDQNSYREPTYVRTWGATTAAGRGVDD
jgi:hypothetical protein